MYIYGDFWRNPEEFSVKLQTGSLPNDYLSSGLFLSSYSGKLLRQVLLAAYSGRLLFGQVVEFDNLFCESRFVLRKQLHGLLSFQDGCVGYMEVGCTRVTGIGWNQSSFSHIALWLA